MKGKALLAKGKNFVKSVRKKASSLSPKALVERQRLRAVRMRGIAHNELPQPIKEAVEALLDARKRRFGEPNEPRRYIRKSGIEMGDMLKKSFYSPDLLPANITVRFLIDLTTPSSVRAISFGERNLEITQMTDNVGSLVMQSKDPKVRALCRRYRYCIVDAKGNLLFTNRMWPNLLRIGRYRAVVD